MSVKARKSPVSNRRSLRSPLCLADPVTQRCYAVTALLAPEWHRVYQAPGQCVAVGHRKPEALVSTGLLSVTPDAAVVAEPCFARAHYSKECPSGTPMSTPTRPKNGSSEEL